MVQVHPGPPLVFNDLPGVAPKTLTYHPKLLYGIRGDSGRHQILPLRRACFVAVFLRVEIEGRLDSRMTQDALHGFRLNFRLVYQPID